MIRHCVMLGHSLLALALGGVVQAALEIRLPTANHHLLTREPDRFFMYVDRTFEGQTSKPWEGGCFGLVRNAMRLGDQVIYTKFHEGIDIAPLQRDAAGNPLDAIASIAAGQVVHTSPVAGRSNYGKYVVVEHLWENSSFYSLYAHLAEISCNPGDPVQAGSVLGRMGYTGTGLNRTRAHCHLEIAMLMSRRYDDWQKTSGSGTNLHGLYNGMNLIGLDPARLFTEYQANPQLTISGFIATVPVHFKVTVPAKGTTPDFVSRYPWICRGNAADAASWEISFSATGLPLAFTPSQHRVDAPTVTAIVPSTIPQRYLTRNLVNGPQNTPTLTSSGTQIVTLLTDDFPLPTAAKTTATPPKS